MKAKILSLLILFLILSLAPFQFILNVKANPTIATDNLEGATDEEKKSFYR
jgi:hypothetical protein